MQIVIDIPDEDYNVILENADFYKEQQWGVAEVWDAIVNGTVLPKGHGDLIDRKELLSHTKCTYRYDCQSGSSCDKCSDNCVEVRDIENATTIVEADKGG